MCFEYCLAKIKFSINVGSYYNGTKLFSFVVFSLTVISTWNISTEKLDRCINSEGDFSSEMEGQGSRGNWQA